MRIFLFVLLSIFIGLSYSGELVKSVKLLEVASHATNGGKNFAVLIDGGVGVCSGKRWIYFPESKAPSLASYNQSFSLALTALSSDKNVRIHNYPDNSCSDADFISISK